LVAAVGGMLERRHAGVRACGGEHYCIDLGNDSNNEK
jgi:hypothetical protein